MTYFLVFGNAAIDYATPTAVIEDRGNSVNVTIDGVTRTVPIIDGPYVAGKKHKVTNIEGLIESFEAVATPKAGGGGHNTSIALAQLRQPGFPFGIEYFDVSEPDYVLIDSLSTHNVKRQWGRQRPIPKRLVVSGKGEVLNIGGERLSRLTDLDYDLAIKIQESLSDDNCMGVIVNSMKDEIYGDLIVEHALSHGKPLNFAVTDSVSKDYFEERMFPNGTVFMSWNEALLFYGANPKAPEIQKVKDLYEILRSWQNQRKNPENGTRHIYVTMGPLGVMCADKEEIHHIFLGRGVRAEMKGRVSMRIGSSNAAGDMFAAAVSYIEATAPEINDITAIAKSGQVHAIKGLYKGLIRDRMFVNELVTSDYLKGTLPKLL